VWSRGQAAGDEEHAEAVVAAVAEASGDAAVELDEPVHGFGAAVARAVGVEVAEEGLAPLLERAAEAGDLGDRTGRQARRDGLGEASSGGVAGLVEAGADLLGAVVGDLDLDVFLAGGERGAQPGLLAFGEVFLAGAEDVPDA
jgi:hypothetical protein